MVGHPEGEVVVEAVAAEERGKIINLQSSIGQLRIERNYLVWICKGPSEN